jgi:hypothetical protein
MQNSSAIFFILETQRRIHERRTAGETIANASFPTADMFPVINPLTSKNN